MPNGTDVSFYGHYVAVINGWPLYRRHSQQLQQSTRLQQDLVLFTAAVREALIHWNKLLPVAVRKRGRPLSRATNLDPADDEEKATLSAKRLVVIPARDAVRFDNIGHLPAHCEPKQRYLVCMSYVCMKCVKCSVHNKRKELLHYLPHSIDIVT